MRYAKTGRANLEHELECQNPKGSAAGVSSSGLKIASLLLFWLACQPTCGSTRTSRVGIPVPRRGT